MSKHSKVYRELRYLYRAFFHYHAPLAYVWNRFWVRPCIRFLKKPIDRPAGDGDYSIHILCSHQDLDMLFWSLASWYSVVKDSGQVFVHEDGSFTKEDRNLISRLLPQSKLIDYAHATQTARDEWLKNYPHTLKYRLDRKYVFTAKLVDPRFVSSVPARLLLDTDILWFSKPRELLQRLKSGKNPFFMLGKSNKSFQFAAGDFLDEKFSALNAGIIGYNVAEYDPRDLEAFCAKMGPASDPYFIEQSGHAWILSRRAEILPLDPGRYIIKGPINEQIVARHYTGPRRELYWIEGAKLLKDKILK